MSCPSTGSSCLFAVSYALANVSTHTHWRLSMQWTRRARWSAEVSGSLWASCHLAQLVSKEYSASSTHYYCSCFRTRSSTVSICTSNFARTMSRRCSQPWRQCEGPHASCWRRGPSARWSTPGKWLMQLLHSLLAMILAGRLGSCYHRSYNTDKTREDCSHAAKWLWR